MKIIKCDKIVFILATKFTTAANVIKISVFFFFFNEVENIIEHMILCTITKPKRINIELNETKQKEDKMPTKKKRRRNDRDRERMSKKLLKNVWQK